MAKEKKQKKKKEDTSGRRKLGAKGMLLLIISAISMVIFLQTSSILFIVGMLPSFVAYYVDVSKYRTTFHTVFAFNLSGVLPFICQLAYQGNNSGDMQMMLSDMEVLFIMYMSAAMGWILIWLTPKFSRFLIAGFNESQITRLETSQKRLIREWGEEIAQKPEAF